MDFRSLRVADLEVRLFGEAPGSGERVEFVDVRAAAAFVTQLLGDPRDGLVLRRIAGELEYFGGEDVVSRLAGALVAGRLVFTRAGAPEAPLVGPAGDEAEGERPSEDGFAAMEAGPPTHWVEIQLVGEDGEGSGAALSHRRARRRRVARLHRLPRRRAAEPDPRRHLPGLLPRPRRRSVGAGVTQRRRSPRR
ncbi:hypothetical protein [Nannocystis pusilla]|uniref:hypothetical protein n=1 Tax=Nannocystis pusilla TaxID=889268 RepID=UPI003B7D10DF